MNWEQLKGIVERIATIGVTYAAAKGWIPNDQVAGIVSVVVLLGSIAWGWKVNTAPALKTAVTNVQ